MRLLSVLPLLAASVPVLAQGTETSTISTTSTTSTPQAASTCEAQNILDTCIRSIQAQVDACGPNEWGCLCEQTNNLLTCYNNCPEDTGRTGVEQQRVSYCNAAGLVSSSSTTSRTATSTNTSTSTATSTSTSTDSEETGATTTSSGAASAETSDDAAVGSVRVDMGLLGLVVLGVLF
ncbi:hypothetical protein BDW59DRAFT_139565 [Aspergillus cavernicola]|uniref:GPI anchored serine-threonine rich protein n=1 Tax=Aspergillus cavernicola TaxID=176166 RepID=A0ABR4IW94_9EURO